MTSYVAAPVAHDFHIRLPDCTLGNSRNSSGNRGLRGVGRVGEADEGRRGKQWRGERGADEVGGVGSNILWHMVGQRCQLQQDIQKHLPLVVWLVWLDPCGVFIPGMRY